MTTPNGYAPPTPPYNPKPQFPKWLLIGAAAAAVVVIIVVVAVVASTGGGDDSDSPAETAGTSTSSAQSAFVPKLDSADFAARWRDKETGEYVTPPQSIKVVGSLDVSGEVESIGYGSIEQSMPKRANYAQTESSFPRNPAISIVADTDGDLRVAWGCETSYAEPEGANCQNYTLTVDVSESQPRVVKAAAERVGSYVEADDSTTTKVAAMSVSNPEQLPASIMGTDKTTGAPTALVLGAVQPEEDSATVYFVVPDALKIFIGELHSTR